jgi:hypothetical protein
LKELNEELKENYKILKKNGIVSIKKWKGLKEEQKDGYPTILRNGLDLLIGKK